MNKAAQFLKKKSNALKADRMIHWITFNPTRASSVKIFGVPVPRLDDDVVLVPGSPALIFDLSVSGEAKRFLENNVLRAPVDRLIVKFSGEIVQDTDGYVLF